MDLPEQPDAADEPIEIGAADDTLRIWKAREAVRHGELRLAAQAASRTAIETRAGSIIGWAVTLAMAAAALALGKDADRYVFPAGTAFVLCMLAAACAAYTVRPQAWGVSGAFPKYIVDHPGASELALQEDLAGHYDREARDNNQQLAEMAKWLRSSWIILGMAPFGTAVLGLLSYLRS